MTLEQQLVEALRQTDAYQPSPDLFARMERSIEEDIAHRRRVRLVGGAILAGLTAVTVFLVAVVRPGVSGLLLAPAWALELVANLVMVAVVLALGPAIRRFGRFYVADVFRLNPATGSHFLDLLDVAFYLSFFGLIIAQVDVIHPGRTVVVNLDAWFYTGRIGGLLLVIGLTHAVTLMLLPAIGILFSSLTRKSRRLDAGVESPPVSARAEQAERVARLLIWGLVALMLAGVLFGAGALFVFGLTG